MAVKETSPKSKLAPWLIGGIVGFVVAVIVVLFLYIVPKAIEREAICGDGVIDLGEDCDTNLGKQDCTTILGSDFTGGELRCTPSCSFDTSSCTLCGNGVIESNEGCDDGDTSSGDGCSSSCNIESGYTCSGAPSVCNAIQAARICGNGITEVGEQCDDGNTNSRDTCDVDGEAPNSAGSCTKTFCGDGVIQTRNGYGIIERCDDGNRISNDGCSSICVIEETDSLCGTEDQVCEFGTGRVCTTSAGYSGLQNCLSDCDGWQTCTSSFSCGDGILNGIEACDNGAANSDSTPNACRTTCKESYCGDGVIDTGERCDDRNTASGDGCSSTCKLEGGYICEGSPSVCRLNSRVFAQYTVDGVRDAPTAELGDTIRSSWSSINTPSGASVTIAYVRAEDNVPLITESSLPITGEADPIVIPADPEECSSFIGARASLDVYFKADLFDSSNNLLDTDQRRVFTIWCT